VSGAQKTWLPALAVTAGAAGAYWARRTHATSGEQRQALPGDDLVPAPDWQATRAITIDAAPSEVWPWLVQMGYPKYRAGWYAPYYLDRLVWRIKERSSEELRADLQDLAVGDRVPDSPDWSVYFVVDELEAEQHLVLRSTTHLLPPYKNLMFTWTFALRPLDEGARTRVIMRARTSFTPIWPRPAVWLFLRLVMDPGDAVEAGSILLGLKRRVERRLDGRISAPSTGGATERLPRIAA
jgi:hypothetical protein